MLYNEINLINTNYILPYSPIVEHIEYCQRDEIADPYKLDCVFNINSTRWSVYENDNKFFYSTLVPWIKKYNSYGIEIESHYFKVLTQDPSMFTVDFNDTENVAYWFDKYHNKIFLITHVVLSHVIPKDVKASNKRQRINEKKYITNKRQLISLNNTTKDSNEEMSKILENKCYAICNGIILLLALHRLNYINVECTKTNLDKLTHPEFRISFDDDEDEEDSENYNNYHINDNFKINKVNSQIDYIQNVNPDWENLYYAYPLIHLSDSPIYYTHFGPNFTHKSICQLFTGKEDIHLTHNQNNQHIYSFPISAQFPYFNTDLWTNYMNNYKQYNRIINTMDDLMNPNIEVPDVTNDYSGILQMFYTDSGWNYWCLNKNIIINNLFNASSKDCYKFLKVAFHHYKYENTNNKKRIACIWEDILSQAFIANNSTNILYLTTLLYIFYGIYSSPYTLFIGNIDKTKTNPPLDFIKYILCKCDNTHIYLSRPVTGYAQNENIKRRIQNLFPQTKFNDAMIINNDNDDSDSDNDDNDDNDAGANNPNKYSISISLHDLIKMNPQHYEYFQKIILTRLLCLKHFTNDYEVYTIICAYIKNNTHLLF